MNNTILVTGGAGYIGSHTCVALLNHGYDVLIIDNFSNSSPIAVERIATITGKIPRLERADIRDTEALSRIFSSNTISAVIHFAGLKAVGESVSFPERYYVNNVHGSMCLTAVMAKYDVRTLVFSSSATVYGDPHAVPISEDFPLQPTNPYGRSKWMIEQILADLATADPRWSISVLRYFNPVGAHPSGLLGEHPNGTPNNLMPYLTQVAVRKRDVLMVFGNDYPTNDGTGVRDYIHVVDLSLGHIAALQKLKFQKGIHTANLGTGRGYSVLELVKAFEQVCGKTIPYRFVGRRPGDIAICYADASFAHRLFGWRASRDLKTMCSDTWRWQHSNPDGYQTKHSAD